MSFIPLPGSEKQGFQATFRHHYSQQGTLQAIPRLSYSKILPNHIPVFQVVRDGQLKELKEMLMLGEVSLRDHDQFSASLLFVSPSPCRLPYLFEMLTLASMWVFSWKSADFYFNIAQMSTLSLLTNSKATPTEATHLHL